MRIKIDYDLCVGHGLCVAAAPKLFEFEDGDQPRVKVDVIAADCEEQARRAGDSCPERAIILEE